MLPRATAERMPREVNRGRPGGRTQEIQRLIGRSLRGVADLRRLGERTVMVDCDVLLADAGTRCASITAGYIALAMALRTLAENGVVKDEVLTDTVAAVSVAIVDGEPVLDLMRGTRRGRLPSSCQLRLIEVQGTARAPFERSSTGSSRRVGIEALTKIQRDALA
jgi:ribonuclease PH